MYRILLLLVCCFLNGVMADIIREKSNMGYKFFKEDSLLNSADVTGTVIEYSINEDSSKIKIGEFNYQNGKLNGLQKEYFVSGALKAEYNMNDGTRDGVGKEFYETGEISYERDFNMGTGKGIEYYANKDVKRTRIFKDNQQVYVSRLNYDIDGNRLQRDSAQGYYLEAQYFAHDKKFYSTIESYRLLIEKFPGDKLVPKVKFLIGFTYNNYLNKTKLARDEYQKFLEEYPDHELAVSAKFELENLGKKISDFPLKEKSE